MVIVVGIVVSVLGAVALCMLLVMFVFCECWHSWMLILLVIVEEWKVAVFIV